MFLIKALPQLHWETGDRLFWGALLLITIEAGINEDGEKYYDLLRPVFDEQLCFYGKGLWMDGGDEGHIRLPDNGNIHAFVEHLYRQVLQEAAFQAEIHSCDSKMM